MRRPSLAVADVVIVQLHHKLLPVIVRLCLRLGELLPLLLLLLILLPQLFQRGSAVRTVLDAQVILEIIVVHIADLHFILQLYQPVDRTADALLLLLAVHVFHHQKRHCHRHRARGKQASDPRVHLKAEL